MTEAEVKQIKAPKAVPQIEAPKVEATTNTAATAGIASFEEIQAKLRDGLAKANALAQEAFEFNKGTVETVVQATKTYGEGLKALVSETTASSRTQFEQTAATLRELAAARSLAKVVELQSQIVRTTTQHALAESTKFFEAYVKLTTDAFAPLPERAKEAVSKVKLAA